MYWFRDRAPFRVEDLQLWRVPWPRIQEHHERMFVNELQELAAGISAVLFQGFCGTEAASEVRGSLTSKILPVLQSHAVTSVPFAASSECLTRIASLEFVMDIE